MDSYLSKNSNINKTEYIKEEQAEFVCITYNKVEFTYSFKYN